VEIGIDPDELSDEGIEEGDDTDDQE